MRGTSSVKKFDKRQQGLRIHKEVPTFRKRTLGGSSGAVSSSTLQYNCGTQTAKTTAIRGTCGTKVSVHHP